MTLPQKYCTCTGGGVNPDCDFCSGKMFYREKPMTDWKKSAQDFVSSLTENERDKVYTALQLIKNEGDSVSDEIPDHVVAFQLKRLMEYLTAVSDEEQ